MPLIKGTVTVTGGVSAGAGLAKELFDALRSELAIPEAPQNNAALGEMAKMCRVLASTVIDHFTANATITASPTLTVPLGIPVSTAGSPAAQTGATTAAGTATGTVSSTLS